MALANHDRCLIRPQPELESPISEGMRLGQSLFVHLSAVATSASRSLNTYRPVPEENPQSLTPAAKAMHKH